MNTDGGGPATAETEHESPPERVGSLRDFVVENGSLLAAIAGLIGIATFVSACCENTLPPSGSQMERGCVAESLQARDEPPFDRVAIAFVEIAVPEVG